MTSGTGRIDSSLTSMWVNFFTAAGIPSEVSATYALTFAENRIQNDMLLDLNKEYLRDMGIVRMGDVIAILRHAKQVHENAARDRVLGTAVAKVPVAAVTGRLTITQNKPSSPASRILEHYTRNSPSQETSPIHSPQLKRKHVDIAVEDGVEVKKSRLIRFAAAASTASVATQPKESLKSASIKTVFARLGGPDPVKKAEVTSVKPIYARLGAKTNEIQKEQTVPIERDALKYEGILKSPPIKKVMVTTSKNNIRKIAMTRTMRADEKPVSIKDKLELPKAKSVKFAAKVEYKEIEANKPEREVKPKVVNTKVTAVFNKPERRLCLSEVKTTASGVKSRLGQSSKNITITRSVFNRLGA